jgi:glycerol-3-phosphate dehydrogenase
VSSEPGYDVAIIGAGVAGAAIARELSRYDLRTVLLEAGDDVGTGTSKANTAIRHTGFDATPGSLESALLRRGFPLLADYAAETGIPLEVTGALLVAWDDGQLAALGGIADRARANGYQPVRAVTVEELYRREPHLGPGARGALEIPGEGIICPFTTPLALATDAVVNGVRLELSSPVSAVRHLPGMHVLQLPDRQLSARWVINAAGLHSDTVDRMFGHESFTITPRRGQLVVFDKLARGLLSSVLLPVPTAVTKGVLLAPTVFGNVLLGPTAEDLQDRGDTGTTAAGLQSLLGQGRRILPALAGEEVTASYAGLRAATEHSDYQITAYPRQRYVCVGGIRSTGLSACMGIAAYVAELLADAGLALKPRAAIRSIRMPPLGEVMRRPYRDEGLIRRDPAYGEILCHCERVTRGEITAAAAAPVPARNLDGLRRRTRAMLGRCQGFYCSARVTAVFAVASGVSAGRLLALGETKERPPGRVRRQAGAG